MYDLVVSLSISFNKSMKSITFKIYKSWLQEFAPKKPTNTYGPTGSGRGGGKTITDSAIIGGGGQARLLVLGSGVSKFPEKVENRPENK